MNYKRGQMKTEVKESLRQTKPNPMLVTFLYSIILMVGSVVINRVCGLVSGNDRSVGQLIQSLQGVAQGRYSVEEVSMSLLSVLAGVVVSSLLVAVLSFIWNSLMDVGYEGYSLSMVRGQNPSVDRVFCGFPKIGGVLVTRLLRGIFVFLWDLLILVVVVLLSVGVGKATGGGSEMILVELVILLAAVVAFVWVKLRYAFADYVLLDRNVGGMEAIQTSKALMKGNAGKLFVLKLSFFGWELLKGVIILLGGLITVLLAGSQLMLLADELQWMAMGGDADLLGVVLVLGTSMIGLMLAGIGCFLLDLWLKPYIAGSIAKLYDMVAASKPGAPQAAPVIFEETAPVAAAPVETVAEETAPEETPPASPEVIPAAVAFESSDRQPPSDPA